MKEQTQETQYNGNSGVLFLTGIVVGGLAGAATMLLLAPQSGQKTRDQIQRKGIELRDQVTGSVDDVMTQVRRTSQQLTDDVREKAEELQQHGQELFKEQRERLSTFVEGKNKDVKIPA